MFKIKTHKQNKYLLLMLLFSIVVSFMMCCGTATTISENERTGKAGLNDTITRGEFVKNIISALGYNIQQGESYADVENHVYSDYIYTAYIDGIIPTSYFGEEFKPDKKITKYEMTYITVRALNLNIFTSQEKFYEDFTSRYVNAAARTYIVFGVQKEDGKKYFYPQQTVTKQEAEEVAERAVKYKASPETYKTEAIFDYAEKNIITTRSEFYDIISAMVKKRMTNFQFSFTLRDGELENAFNCFFKQRPEYSIQKIEFLIYDDINMKNTIKLQYINSSSDEKKEREKIDDVIREFKSNYIRNNMSDYDKIKAIHDYLVKNCEYDISAINAKKTSSSHTAYGALVLRKAVCQGYAAAFNIMAKEVGIKSIAVPGTPPKSDEQHMWNMVLVGGKIYYVDATWDDPVPDVKNKIIYDYFWKTESEFKELGYIWETEENIEEYFYKVSQ